MSSINAKVPPLRLVAVDTPADGEIPSYQSSSGEFEWIADSSGMSSFDVAGDTGAAQTITNGNTLTIKNAAGGAIKTVGVATDELTIDLTVSGVTAASYTNTSLTVDAQGRITAASSGSGLSFPLEGSDGSAATPTYSFSADTDTGIYRYGEGMIGFTGNGVSTLSVYQDNVRLEGSSDPQIISCDDAAVDLELRSGGGTYGKIHIGRENENIEIVPGGTGEIEINGAYKLPLVVTGANDYLLTAQTDGSTAWAAAAGGGGEFSNKWTETQAGSQEYSISQTYPFGATETSNQGVEVNTSFFPFISPVTGDVAKANIYVGTAVAGKSMYWGVYSDDGGIPNSLMGQCTFDLSAVGEISQTSFTSTISLTKGEMYWYAYRTDDTTWTTQCTAIQGNNIPNLGITSSLSQRGAIGLQSFAAGNLPASFSYGAILTGQYARLHCSIDV